MSANKRVVHAACMLLVCSIGILNESVRFSRAADVSVKLSKSRLPKLLLSQKLWLKLCCSGAACQPRTKYAGS